MQFFALILKKKTFSKEEIEFVKQKQKEKFDKKGTFLFLKFKNTLYFENINFMIETLLQDSLIEEESIIQKFHKSDLSIYFCTFFFDFLKSNLELFKHIPFIFFKNDVKDCLLLEQLDSKESMNLKLNVTAVNQGFSLYFSSCFRSMSCSISSYMYSNFFEVKSLNIYLKYVNFFLKSKYGIVLQFEDPAEFSNLQRHVKEHLQNLKDLLEGSKKKTKKS